MRLDQAINTQPHHSSIYWERGVVMLQRTVVFDEADVEQVLEQVPWTTLVFLKCDRQQGGKRILYYRWRAEPDGWT
ncbi:MAG: hypothetical protein WKH64_13280 [Chloroflexia bacterium]